MLQTLTKAGVKDAFIVVSLVDLPNEPPFVVLPLEKGSDPKAILDLTPAPEKGGPPANGPFYTGFRCEQFGSAIVYGNDTTRKRLKTLKPEPRPEVARAFAAAGDDGVAQAVLFATTDTRKILEDALPMLPPELGGGSIKTVTRGLQWIAIKIDAPPKMSLHFIYQASDNEAAKQLLELLVKGVKFVGAQKDFKEELPLVLPLLDALTPKVDGDRLTRTVDDATLTSLLLPPLVQKVRGSAAHSQAMNNLKQLGLAMHYYHDANGRLPAVASFDKKNKPLLSWRVHLLPYLEHDQLYKEFHLDEPWDSEHNKKLIAKMPKVFANPANPRLAAEGKTTYVAPVHSTAIFTGDLQGSRITDIADGTSITVLLVDVDDADAVVWTKPDDLKFDPKEPAKGLSTRFGDSYLFLFADGSVHTVTKKIDKAMLNAIFTKNGGEECEFAVSREHFERGQA